MKMLFALVALLLASHAGAIAPKEVSRWKVPGQRTQGECVKYAFCVNYLLFQQGIESKMLAYDFPHRGSWGHAVVLFHLGSQWYLIENEGDRAIPVAGNTELERVQSFDRTATSVRTCNLSTNEILDCMKQLRKTKSL